MKKGKPKKYKPNRVNLIEGRSYIVEMPNKKKYAVPVRSIAVHRACHYAKRENISFNKSFYGDTIPLFESDFCAIHDWAANNMNWKDVEDVAEEVKEDEFQEGWVNGPWEVK